MDLINKAFCPCCYEHFDTEEIIPKVLMCGHSVCGACAGNMLENGSIKCPICRRSTDIPGNDVHQMTNNFSLIDLLTLPTTHYDCQHCKIRTSDPDSVQLCRECCHKAGLTVDIKHADVPKLQNNLICCKCFLTHHFGETKHTRVSFFEYAQKQQHSDMAEFLPNDEETRILAIKMNNVISHLDSIRQALSSAYEKKKYKESMDTLADLKELLKNNSASYRNVVNILQNATNEASAEVENISLKLLTENSGDSPPQQMEEPPLKYPKKLLQDAISFWSIMKKVFSICMWLFAIKISYTVGSFFISDPSSLVFLLTLVICILSVVIFR